MLPGPILTRPHAHHHRLNLSPSLPFCLSIFLAQAQYFELLKRYRAPDQRLWGNIGIVDGSVCIEGWAWLCESCVLSTRLRQLIFLQLISTHEGNCALPPSRSRPVQRWGFCFRFFFFLINGSPAHPWLACNTCRGMSSIHPHRKWSINACKMQW